LRRILGPKRNNVRGEWRKLQNKELNYLYSSLNTVRVIKSRRMRLAGHVQSSVGNMREAKRVVMGKDKGKRPLEKPRCR
jgi:hypothetical protein